jgi:hypothetical protein
LIEKAPISEITRSLLLKNMSAMKELCKLAQSFDEDAQIYSCRSMLNLINNGMIDFNV